MTTHVAIDIGGSHGRGALAFYTGDRYRMVELGTFSNMPLNIDGQLFWDFKGILRGIGTILCRAANLTAHIDTIGIDSMGLAFALLDKEGHPQFPLTYTRDSQETALKSQILQDLGSRRLFEINGLEQRKLNTLYYLKAMKQNERGYPENVSGFIMLPDLLLYCMTGEIYSEYTISSTSGLMDIRAGKWSPQLVSYVGLPIGAMPKIVQAGHIVGRVRPQFCDLPALDGTLAVNVAEHDTAAALFAAEKQFPDAAFVVAGTWGMFGCLTEAPILSSEVLNCGFANEGAANHRIALLHNSPCMSIVDACVAALNRNSFGWSPQLFFEKAALERDFPSRIDLQHPLFRGTVDMPEAIATYCARTDQQAPRTPTQMCAVVINSVLENFSSAYRNLCHVASRTFPYISAVGGASQSLYFRKKLEELTGVKVHQGPHEASVAGNIAIQHAATAASL